MTTDARRRDRSPDSPAAASSPDRAPAGTTTSGRACAAHQRRLLRLVWLFEEWRFGAARRAAGRFAARLLAGRLGAAFLRGLTAAFPAAGFALAGFVAAFA